MAIKAEKFTGDNCGFISMSSVSLMGDEEKGNLWSRLSLKSSFLQGLLVQWTIAQVYRIQVSDDC